MEIYINADMKRTLDTLINEYKEHEFSLRGKSKLDLDNNRVELVDLRVQWQESTSCTTDTIEDMDYEFHEQLLKDGENPKDWNFNIHSHNTMGANWSSGDMEHMKSLKKFNIPYHFFVVMSTKGYKGAYACYKPFMFISDDVPVKFGDTSTDKEVLRLEKEIDKLYKQFEKLSELKNKPNEYTKRLIQELKTKNKLPEPKGVVSYNPITSQYTGKNASHGQTEISDALAELEERDTPTAGYYWQVYDNYYEIVHILNHTKNLSETRRSKLLGEMVELGEIIGYSLSDMRAELMEGKSNKELSLLNNK